jgi:hypothetical protein
MTRTKAMAQPKGDAALRALFQAIGGGKESEALRLLKASPDLAQLALDQGATRTESTSNFLVPISHYVYAGDTALHVAAAAYSGKLVDALLARGAAVAAENRRGAQPLHYAVDGGPGTFTWDPEAQGAVVARLIEAGADPNAANKDGATPLHRAVRTRCTAAVAALLAGGADLRRGNQSGATALHLAVQTTGRGGSGSAPAREQQEAIIGLLLEHGARLTDRDQRGKTVADSITSDWVRELLAGRRQGKR